VLGAVGRLGLISPKLFSAAETFANSALSAAASRNLSILAFMIS
jgi:hypothetical protein